MSTLNWFLFLALLLTEAPAIAQGTSSPPEPRSTISVADAMSSPHWRDLIKAAQASSRNRVDEDGMRSACATALQGATGTAAPLDACLAAALETLDPMAVYYPPAEAVERRKERPPYTGIGLELVPKLVGRPLLVVAPISGAPGERAGVRAKDRILAINGEDLRPLTTEETLVRLRQPAGADLRLTIEREGTPPGQTIELVARAEVIRIASVRRLAGTPSIAVVRISQFNSDSSADFMRVVERIAAEGPNRPTSLLIDVRANTGGILDSVVRVAAVFADDETEVGRLVKRGVATALTASRAKGDAVKLSPVARDWLAATRIAVLVSKRTANGAELFARFMQEQRQALLLGEASAGISFVSEVFSLGSDALMQLPVGELRSAHDFSWVGAGLKPSPEVEGLVRGDWGSNGDGILRRALAALAN